MYNQIYHVRRRTYVASV